jgi:hypothetical protein
MQQCRLATPLSDTATQSVSHCCHAYGISAEVADVAGRHRQLCTGGISVLIRSEEHERGRVADGVAPGPLTERVVSVKIISLGVLV